MDNLFLKLVDWLQRRVLLRDQPPLDLPAFLAAHDVPGRVIAGERALMRRLVGVGAGLPTVLVVNAALERVYLSRGFRPEAFARRLDEAITCNVSFCDPDSAYAREKDRYRGSVPDLPLPGVDGSSAPLSTLIPPHGVAVIDFWASWCAPCFAAFADLRALEEKHREAGAVFLSVNVGS